MRLVLAATLSSVYGIYSGYELCENVAVPGTEEYLDAEKYEIKVRNWKTPGNITDYISRINAIRRENPALAEHRNLRFYESDDDNILLGDRAGVRTPMQWSADRNGGFSRADPGQLYSPVIADPLYGYQPVNVEAQLRTPSSLLHWMRRLIATRKKSRVFGRGSLRFLQPANTRVLAHLREYRGETILAVHNLANSAEPVELNLKEFKGAIPVEMLGEARFPSIGEQP